MEERRGRKMGGGHQTGLCRRWIRPPGFLWTVCVLALGLFRRGAADSSLWQPHHALKDWQPHRVLEGVMRLRGGDTVVSPRHTARLARKMALLRERNGGRLLSPAELKAEQRRPQRTLLVHNLHESVDEIRLLHVFALGGDVVKVSMPRDEETTQHHGYAYVEFRRSIDAAAALCCFNMVKLNDKPLKIRHLISGAAAEKFYHPGAKLFISRLAPEVTEWELWWSLQVFGIVMDCRIPTNPTTQESRGIAFIRFADFDACEKALHLMDGQVIAGREISVRYAHDCVLPDHLVGTPWQGKQRVTVRPRAKVEAAVPDWMQEVREQLSEDEQRLQGAADKAKALARGRAEYQAQKEQQRSEDMRSIFGGGVGKKKWADRRGGAKTTSLLGVPVDGLRGGCPDPADADGALGGGSVLAGSGGVGGGGDGEQLRMPDWQELDQALKFVGETGTPRPLSANSGAEAEGRAGGGGSGPQAGTARVAAGDTDAVGKDVGVGVGVGRRAEEAGAGGRVRQDASMEPPLQTANVHEQTAEGEALTREAVREAWWELDGAKKLVDQVCQSRFFWLRCMCHLIWPCALPIMRCLSAYHAMPISLSCHAYHMAVCNGHIIRHLQWQYGKCIWSRCAALSHADHSSRWCRGPT